MYIFDRSRCRNLIFDLGGVLYGLDLGRSMQAFAAFRPARPPADLLADPVLLAMEKGLLSPEDLSGSLREAWSFQAADAEVLHAWNAMLTGLLPGRVEMLNRLAKDFRLALLSNTNVFHYQFLLPECREMFSIFERCFFSFEMGMRKPEEEIYRAALAGSGFAAEETVFIDDQVPNVRGAAACGMSGLHFRQEGDLEKWFFTTG